MGDYIFVSQGKTRIPGVNDAEEMLITDVSELLCPLKESLLRVLSFSKHQWAAPENLKLNFPFFMALGGFLSNMKPNEYILDFAISIVWCGSW